MNRFIEKYRAMSLPLKASLWLAICSIIQKGVAFLTTPIFTRILSKHDYGVYSVYNSWLSILYIITTFELAMGHFNKGMIKFEHDRDGYTSSILTLATIFVSGFSILYVAFHGFWNRLMDLNTPLMAMMLVDILFTEAMGLWSIRQRFEFRYRGVVLVTVLANVVGTLLSVVLVITHEDHLVEYRVAGTLIVHILMYGAIYALVMRRGGKYYVPEYWGFALRYNLPLIPHYLSLIILNQSDRIMIGRISGSEYAAIYTVAYQVAILMNIIVNAVHSSFTPWAFEKMKRGDYHRIGAYTYSIEVIFAGACFLFSLFAPELVMVLGGRAYYEAIWIIPPVTMSIVFNVLYSLIANVEFYYEKTNWVMVGTIIASTMNIVLNAIFIRIFGFVAAGYTTLFCYMLLSVLHYFIMLRVCREHGITSPYNGRKIWSLAAVAVLLSIMSVFLYTQNMVRYCAIVALCLVAFRYRRRIISVVRDKDAAPAN